MGRVRPCLVLGRGHIGPASGRQAAVGPRRSAGGLGYTRDRGWDPTLAGESFDRSQCGLRRPFSGGRAFSAPAGGEPGSVGSVISRRQPRDFPDVLAGKFRSVGQRSPDVLGRELRVFLNDLLRGKSLGQTVKDDGDVDPRPPNAGLPPADIGINYHSAHEFFPCRTLPPPPCPILCLAAVACKYRARALECDSSEGSAAAPQRVACR